MRSFVVPCLNECVFLFVRIIRLRVCVMRDLAQSFGRSVGRSGFGAELRVGLRRIVSVSFVRGRMAIQRLFF